MVLAARRAALRRAGRERVGGVRRLPHRGALRTSLRALSDSADTSSRGSTRTGSTRWRWGWRSTASSPSRSRPWRWRDARERSRCREARCGRRTRHSASGWSWRHGGASRCRSRSRPIYLVCLPFAAREGVGSVTSFGYAYLAAVGARRASLRPRSGSSRRCRSRESASTRPASRATSSRRPGSRSSRRRAAAGVFALAGTPIVGGMLGARTSRRRRRRRLGRLVALLSPWMVVAVALSVTLPLVFVQSRTRGLPLVALAVLVLHVPLASPGGRSPVSPGLSHRARGHDPARARVMLRRLDAAQPTLSRLFRAAVVVGALVVVAFGCAGARPLAGRRRRSASSLYAVALALRPPGLMSAWRYLRELA